MCGTAHPEPTPESSTGLLWVLVVDDEEIVRCGLDTMLGMLPRVARRDAISSWDELRPLVRGCELPDIVLVGSALAAGRPPELHAPRLLLLLRNAEEHDLEQAVNLSADGYLMLGGLSGGALDAALAEVSAGRVCVPQEVTHFLFLRARAPRSRADIGCLTPREQEVLGLLTDGLMNKGIANRLQISVFGVKRHVSGHPGQIRLPDPCPGRDDGPAQQGRRWVGAPRRAP